MRATVDRESLIEAVERAAVGDVTLTGKADTVIVSGGTNPETLEAVVEDGGAATAERAALLAALGELARDTRVVVAAANDRLSLSNAAGQVRTVSARTVVPPPSPSPPEVVPVPHVSRELDGDRLYASWSALGRAFAPPAILLALSVVGDLTVWVGIFAAVTIVLALCIITRQVVFDSEGLRFVQLFHIPIRRSIRWSEVDRFFVDRTRRTEFVAYKLKRPRTLKLSQKRDGSFPATLAERPGGEPLRPSDLRDVLTTLQLRYGESRASENLRAAHVDAAPGRAGEV